MYGVNLISSRGQNIGFLIMETKPEDDELIYYRGKAYRPYHISENGKDRYLVYVNSMHYEDYEDLD